MSKIIQAEDLWRTYKLDDVEVHALRGISLSLEEGDFTALVGASGCGKSTLLHLLGCLDRPTAGSVTFAGKDVSLLRDSALTRIRARRIGFIFQMFNLMPTLSARNNVLLQLRVAGFRGARAKRMAEEALEKVGLTQRMKHLPRHLSGGERQRVAIARAISKAPELVLADEPTGNLDSKASGEIVDLLSKLNQDGHTILMVTHDSEAAAAAKTVLTMRDGRLEQPGP